VKVLFLDIDGVLNSLQYVRRVKQAGTWGIDPNTIPHLQRIVDETDCVLVLSSTWRLLHRMPYMRQLLQRKGMRYPVPLIDKTPSLQSQSEGGIWMQKVRGDEVAAWLETAQNPVESYVCLDDDGDFLPHQPLVQTNVETGLTADLASRCIDILGRKPLNTLGPQT